MSRPRAPTAMRSPISRVRSVTLTSMMFMMPMPPTTRLTPATAASSSVITRLDSSCAASISVRLRTLKSSSCPGCRRWRWRSSSRMFSSAAFMLWPSRTFTLIEPTRFRRPPLMPWMRLRKVDSGTMTTSSWSWPTEFWPLRASTPITVSGTFFTRMVWSIGSAPPNSCSATVWPMIATLPEPAMFGRLEAAAFGQRPVAHLEVVGRQVPKHLRCSSWCCRPPPARRCAATVPPPAPRARRRAMARRVLLGQRLAGLRAQPHAALRLRAGQHQHDVGAQALDLFLDALLRARADGDHRDHRGHADDDAQHRQDAAQQVGGERAPGGAQGGEARSCGGLGRCRHRGPHRGLPLGLRRCARP